MLITYAHKKWLKESLVLGIITVYEMLFSRRSILGNFVVNIAVY